MLPLRILHSLEEIDEIFADIFRYLATKPVMMQVMRETLEMGLRESCGIHSCGGRRKME